MTKQAETIFKRGGSCPDSGIATWRKLSGVMRYGLKRNRFSFYCEDWARQERGKVKDSTYIKYDNALRRHILPRMGGFFPSEFSTQLVDMFRDHLLEEFSIRTVRGVLVVLQLILRYTSRQYPGVFPIVEIAC